MGMFEGPYVFFWIFAGAIAIVYHAYFFWESVIKVDAKPKKLPEDLPENLILFPGLSSRTGASDESADPSGSSGS